MHSKKLCFEYTRVARPGHKWRTGALHLPDGPKKLQLAVEEEQQQFKDLDRQQGDAITEQPGVPKFRIFPLPRA